MGVAIAWRRGVEAGFVEQTCQLIHNSIVKTPLLPPSLPLSLPCPIPMPTPPTLKGGRRKKILKKGCGNPEKMLEFLKECNYICQPIWVIPSYNPSHKSTLHTDHPKNVESIPNIGKRQERLPHSIDWKAGQTVFSNVSPKTFGFSDTRVQTDHMQTQPSS